jgi:hypothetical protein
MNFMRKRYSNKYYDAVSGGLRHLRASETNPERKEYISRLLDDMQSGHRLTEAQINELRMMAVRFPDFDGDYIGQWNDDDKDDDEDEQEGKSKK